jgi:mannose/cellobiose epimerase-like protein (N-acyl-D-glucosamine 2-epimerase family)
MSEALNTLIDTHRAARDWSISQALPLWGTVGFDRSAGVFEEQLDFDRKVITTVPRRAMVQARQIVVFSSAALDGWYEPGRALALAAADNLIGNYWAKDGKPGYVFSLTRDGRVADAKRDLYAHAFVLFALAWRMRLGASPTIEAAITQVIAYIREAFCAADGEGYVCTLPRPDAIRRQNPHMHLFEAAVEFFEATGNPSGALLADEVRALASRRFIQPETGALLEYFTDDWRQDAAAGAPARSEPGHQMEWAWLLRRHEQLSGKPDTGQVRALIDFALRTGIDPENGRVVDEVDATGQITKASSRSWPHTETVKALAREASHSGDLSRVALLATIYGRLMTAYCSPDLQGGWIDQRDDRDAPSAKVMPASTLYHVHLAIREVERLLKQIGTL